MDGGEPSTAPTRILVAGKTWLIPRRALRSRRRNTGGCKENRGSPSTKTQQHKIIITGLPRAEGEAQRGPSQPSFLWSNVWIILFLWAFPWHTLLRYPDEIPPPPLPNFPCCHIRAHPLIFPCSPSPWLLQEGSLPQIKEPTAIPQPWQGPCFPSAGDNSHSELGDR